MVKQSIQQLSKELARIAGLKLRPPREGEDGHVKAGSLRSRLPADFFEWRKCPFHGTWLQPQFQPYPHWACMAKDFCKDMHEIHSTSGASTRVLCKGHACTFKRAAKMRTQIERTVFRVAKFLEEHG